MLLKNGTRDYYKSSPFERSACFYVAINGNFARFWYFNFETFSKKWKRFSKKWSTVFWLKALRLKTHHFHTKLPYQKPMLRQIDWWVKNGPITKSGVLPVTILFFLKILFQFKNLLFFYVNFLSQTFTNHRTPGEGGGHFINSSLPLPHASQTHRH